jgi:hypothetical protein
MDEQQRQFLNSHRLCYVTIFGTGRIEKDGAVDVMARVGDAISGRPVLPEARAALRLTAQCSRAFDAR